VEVLGVSFDKDSSGRKLTVHPGEWASSSLIVQNHGSEWQTLVGVALLDEPPGLYLDQGGVALPLQIPPTTVAGSVGGSVSGNLKTFVLRVASEDSGVTNAALVFTFAKGFSIKRLFLLRCGDPDLSRLLEPTAPFQRPPRRGIRFIQSENNQASSDIGTDKKGKATIQRGVRFKSPSGTGYKRPNQYPIPSSIKDMVLYGEANAIFEERLDNLSESNYIEHFQHLLWAEELQINKDILVYNLSDAVLTPKDGGFLSLQVPGLSENRPSVQKGDAVLVRRSSDGENSVDIFEGFTHQIENDFVLLKFAPDFHKSFILGQTFYVQFTFKRNLLRIFHQSIGLCKDFISSSKSSVLFPTEKISSISLSDPSSLPILDRRLNDEQRKAVQKIVEARFKSNCPYVIFGPPGTGLITFI
jgi:helicase MOV-10